MSAVFLNGKYFGTTEVMWQPTQWEHSSGPQFPLSEGGPTPVVKLYFRSIVQSVVRVIRREIEDYQD